MYSVVPDIMAAALWYLFLGTCSISSMYSVSRHLFCGLFLEHTCIHMQHTHTHGFLSLMYSVWSHLFCCVLFLEHTHIYIHMQHTCTQFSIVDAFILKSCFASAFSIFHAFSLKSSILLCSFLEHTLAHAAFSHAASLPTHHRLSLALLPGQAGTHSLLCFNFQLPRDLLCA